MKELTKENFQDLNQKKQNWKEITLHQKQRQSKRKCLGVGIKNEETEVAKFKKKGSQSLRSMKVIKALSLLWDLCRFQTPAEAEHVVTSN